MRWLPIMLLTLAPTLAWAQDLRLSSPIGCGEAEGCFIQQYMDHDPGPGARDFACGSLVYDGHKGTDFALPFRTMVEAGVPVLAAAPGTVRGTRDGMADLLQTGPDRPDLGGLDCGNGVVIAHPGGWETQYCHLRRGSIAVVEGQAVDAGTVLGEVGLSGNTQFPHLHLSVRRDGDPVDPFDPDGDLTCGAPSEDTLWIDRPETPAGGLIAAGFADAVPSYDAIRLGGADAGTLPMASPALVLWGYAFGGRAGDVLRFTIDGPDGPWFETEVELERTQAQLFRATGRRARDGLAPGGWVGTVEHLRDGEVLDRQTAQLQVN